MKLSSILTIVFAFGNLFRKKTTLKKPQIILMDAPEPMHPLVRAGLEQQRKQRILHTLRAFYSTRPRPWRGHQRRALARKGH